MVLDGLSNILKMADEEAETIANLIEECGGEQECLIEAYKILTRDLKPDETVRLSVTWIYCSNTYCTVLLWQRYSY